MRPHNFLLAGLMVSLAISMLPVCGIAAEASNLQIRSASLSDGRSIPVQFTCDGANHSPPLSWNGVPKGTKSLALILEDPDAPGGTFVHWVVYDIPPGRSFDEGTVAGKEGANSMDKAGYMGPCPPPGQPHHYHFRLFALDTNLSLGANANAPAVRDAMKGHVIESADLVGIFAR